VEFLNSYDDARRAEAYAALDFPGTYYLAFRDLPSIILEHAGCRRAIDFGCGAGRSTRFLRELGFEVVGVDISKEMIRRARERDPAGDYRLIENGGMPGIEPAAYDLVLCAFTFDNIPTMEKKVSLLTRIRRLLKPQGTMINVVSTPDMYVHEWASFSTRDFPENRLAKAGDTVRIVITAVEDARPVEDIVWPDEVYCETYRKSGLEIAARYTPLGREGEPFAWVNETRIAPWAIYALRPAAVTSAF
jgi:ubiquinone/menaquinone biosynthesis C-methylase UbiE